MAPIANSSADEINAAQITLESLETQLRQLLIPKDPNENKNVIIEIPRR